MDGAHAKVWWPSVFGGIETLRYCQRYTSRIPFAFFGTLQSASKVVSSSSSSTSYIGIMCACMELEGHWQKSLAFSMCGRGR
jgi:hypothetical protein